MLLLENSHQIIYSLDNILLKFRRRFESTDKATFWHIHCQRRILPPKFTLSSSTIIPFQAL